MASTPRRLPPPEIESRLRAQFGEDIVAFEEQFGHAVAGVTRERFREVVTFLRDEPDIACDYCEFTTGVDWQDEGIDVVTHLHSSAHAHDVRLKVRLPADDLVCPTISDLFAGSDWHERETAEMFGVEFEGHPLPVKLLLHEPFEGHPLRKDFPLMSREAKTWPGAVEGEEEEEE